jgi:hypothetical protein
MMLDGATFYFISAATIWQLLNIFIIRVKKTLKIKTISTGDIFNVVLN